MKTEKTRATKNIWLKKKKVLTLANRKRRHNVHLSLLADFLGNRISAAGVSHVIKAPSPLRRTLWAAIILITAMGMAFMTYRVLQEYLAYPTIMRSKDNAVTELEFPAVTVCGMSPIPTLFAKEAGLEYMEEMRSIMSDLPKYSISEENKTRCLKDPLCYWDWFSDFCVCFANPCQTLYCYPDADVSDDKCECSKLMCHWSGSAESCYFGTDSSGTTCCICRTNFTYPLANYWKYIRKECDEESRESCGPEHEGLPEDFVEGLEAVNANEQIKEFWTRLKGSRTQDLKDIERFFVPHVSVMDNYGFPMDSIILSCNFGVEECHDFVTLYTPSYGKCYMFNYIGEEAIKNRKVRTVSQPGKQHGLQLFMRSRSNDSLPLFTRQLGVRLIIHDPRSIPVVSEDGIDLRPGDMTTINLEYKEIHRLGPPWGKCAYNGQKLGSYSQDPYKQNDCERECVSAEIYRRCDCYHPRYLRATTVPRRGKVCHTNTSEEDHCFLATMKDNDSGKVKCNCPPACREKTYEMSLSSSKLNEDFFKLVKTARSLSVVNGTPAVTKAEFGTSLLGVQIHYNSLFSTSINETAIYSWESLIANIGGNMGLFLGLSLVTILEVLEFFTDMIYSVFVKRKTRQSKVKVENMSYSY